MALRWATGDADRIADARMPENRDLSKRQPGVDLEARQSVLCSSVHGSPAEGVERAVFEAWKKWYGDALDSVRRLPVGGPDRRVDEQVDAAIARVMRRSW